MPSWKNANPAGPENKEAMEAKAVLYPLLAMVVLTMGVAGLMLKRRVAGLKAGRIHPQKVALSAQIAELLTDTRASDNFRNLFETPVLFYTALVTVYAARLGSLASRTHSASAGFARSTSGSGSGKRSRCRISSGFLWAMRFGAEGDGPSLYLDDPEGNRVELKGPVGEAVS